MKRSVQHVANGERSSTLALLAVGTILLAAGGETMHHAHATASEGRWAGPTVGAEAATSAEGTVVAAKETVNTMTAPVFKPFVFVELPLPDGYTLVHEAGVHLNDDGVVVATMNNGSVNHGFIWYDELYAAGWQGPLEANSSPIVLDDAGLAGINDDLEICGTRLNSGPKAFFLALTSASAGTLTQIGTGYASDVNNSGVVVGTSLTGAPVAWSMLFGAPVLLPPLAFAVGTAAHGVTPGPAYPPVIVGQSEDADFDVQAVAWFYVQQEGWNVEALTTLESPAFATAVEINEDLHIIGAIMEDPAQADETVLWVYNSGWTGKTLDIATPFIPEALNDETLPEVVGEHYLWKATNLAATPIEGQLLDPQNLMLSRLDVFQMRCTDITESGEIAGVAQLDDANGEWIAFKLVPYDVDNDGAADFREILEGSEADTNSNWLIDDGEQMRVGLHAPGYSDGLGHHIPYVQAVRLLMHLAILPVEISELDDEYALNGVLADDECSFREDIERWTRGTAQYPKQREAIITMRSTLEGIEDLDHDYLPTGTQEATILADLREFGYLYARCIDWVQFGNEAFGGAGQYKFRVGELGQTCGPSQERTYGQLSEECQLVAMDAILDWLDVQMWAALEGSALAGRPLRMIVAGLSADKVNLGYESDNHQRDETTKIADWVNQRQMYFDMHDIWTAVGPAAAAPDRLMGTNGINPPPPWTPPALAVSLEWRPRVDISPGGWYTPSNRAIYVTFRDDEGPEPGHPENFCWDDLPFPLEVWDDFVVDWRETQFLDAPTYGDRFGMQEVLAALGGAAFTVACYGQTGMQQPSNMPYDMACLIASHVCSMYLDSNREPFSKATVAFDEFVGEDVAEVYWIDPFTPHGNQCPQCSQ